MSASGQEDKNETNNCIHQATIAQCHKTLFSCNEMKIREKGNEEMSTHMGSGSPCHDKMYLIQYGGGNADRPVSTNKISSGQLRHDRSNKMTATLITPFTNCFRRVQLTLMQLFTKGITSQFKYIF